jgi:hypothetical protein
MFLGENLFRCWPVETINTIPGCGIDHDSISEKALSTSALNAASHARLPDFAVCFAWVHPRKTGFKSVNFQLVLEQRPQE